MDVRRPLRSGRKNFVLDNDRVVLMEHRHATRHRIFWPVELVAADVNDTGLAANISRDGVFVRSAADFDLGKCVDLQIRRTRHDDRPVALKALVVHRQGRGFGLMFREHSDEIDSIIDSLSQPARSGGRQD